MLKAPVTAVVLLLSVCGIILFSTAYASDIKSDEEVVFFPTQAYYDPALAKWHVPVHGWVFERENDSLWRSALTSTFVHSLGIDDSAVSEELFRQRVTMFLVDNERNKRLRVRVGTQQIIADKSTPNGHFHGNALLRIEDFPLDRDVDWLQIKLLTPPGDSRSFTGQVQLLKDSGVSVISDIDDTVKISNVQDKHALVENTFLKPFAVVPGMQRAYAHWEKQGAAFHYVSASPWQLYPALADFLKKAGLPAGSFHLKTFRVKDETFFDLFASSFEYKISAISEMLKRSPHRKFILVGDSGEKDPEIYAAIYQQFAGQIKHIFIRNVSGKGAAAKLRYTETFKNVPAELWTVFDEPGVLLDFTL